jgi:N-acyl homoserine lactone hydrolase
VRVAVDLCAAVAGRSGASARNAARVENPACLLGKHPSAGAILVDTGLHPSIATDPKANFGTLAARSGKPTLAAGEDVPSQLRERGLEPGEIPIVVMTHMHLDHTSAISEFPSSTFVVSETEWQAAAHGFSPILNGYRRAHFDYAFEYRTIDFNRDNVDSYASFGRTFDLFGDGSIHLAYTPGHISAICRLEKRDFVIGGGCLFLEGQLDGSESPSRAPGSPQRETLPAGDTALPQPVTRRGDHPGARSGVLRGRVERVYR